MNPLYWTRVGLRMAAERAYWQGDVETSWKYLFIHEWVDADFVAFWPLFKKLAA